MGDYFLTQEFSTVNHYTENATVGMDGGGKMNTLDWDKVLGAIHLEAEKRLIQVEMLLASRSLSTDWVNGSEQLKGQAPILVAHGTGVIHALSDIHFNWTLHYPAWDFPEINQAIAGLEEYGRYDQEEVDGMWPGRAYLDFGSVRSTISTELERVLTNKIRHCSSPMSYIENMPTVQDALTVIKQFLIFEYAFSERKYCGVLDRGALEDFENKLQGADNLLNWAYFWLKDREADQEKVEASLGEFLHAIRSCWNVGETFRFTLPGNAAEIGHIKKEA